MNGGELILSKVVTALVLGALARAALRRAPATFDGDPLLAHGRVFGGLAFLFAVVAPAAVGYLCAIQPPRDETGVRNVYVILAIFLGIGLPLGWEWLRFRCVLTPQGFDYRSPWTGSRFVPLNDVVGLSFGSLSSCFTLTTRDGRRHRISPYVVGIGEFIAYCRHHLPYDVWREALDGFAQIEGGGESA